MLRWPCIRLITILLAIEKIYPLRGGTSGYITPQIFDHRVKTDQRLQSYYYLDSVVYSNQLHTYHPFLNN
jgi:hypothetical protein